jgi:ribose transport system permease protein
VTPPFLQIARGGSPAAPRLLPDVLAPRLGLFGDERPQQRDALIVVFYALLVAVILWYVLEWTPMGRHLRATGSGREAARLTGVRTDKWLFLSFVMSGAIAALAGFMQTSRVGSAPPDIGANFLLPAYAATFLGATTIHAGRFNVRGMVVRVLVLAVGITGLNLP